MAKTIKFNLICDNTPVRTLEDLQENFVIEDVLAYYNDKLLHRWLKVRGYSEELAKVEGITSSDEMDIIKELIEIFNVSVDKSKVDEEVYMLQFLAEREKLYAEYDRTHYLSKKVIEDYKNGYIELIKKIINNPSDISIIKSCIKEMVENYDWVLELNHRDLFNDLLEKSKLAVMCLLMNEKLRSYYLPIEMKKEDGTVINDLTAGSDKFVMYSSICAMIKNGSLEEEFGDNLHIFSGETEGYWRDLETKDKKYMIISMDNGDFVRSAGLQNGDKSSNDVREKFLILDGIDYKSNYATHKLKYMEV